MIYGIAILGGLSVGYLFIVIIIMRYFPEYEYKDSLLLVAVFTWIAASIITLSWIAIPDRDEKNRKEGYQQGVNQKYQVRIDTVYVPINQKVEEMRVPISHSHMAD